MISWEICKVQNGWIVRPVNSANFGHTLDTYVFNIWHQVVAFLEDAVRYEKGMAMTGESPQNMEKRNVS